MPDTASKSHKASHNSKTLLVIVIRSSETHMWLNTSNSAEHYAVHVSRTAKARLGVDLDRLHKRVAPGNEGAAIEAQGGRYKGEVHHPGLQPHP